MHRVSSSPHFLFVAIIYSHLMILTHLLAIFLPFITCSLSILHLINHSCSPVPAGFSDEKNKSPFIDHYWFTLVFITTITHSHVQHCFLAQIRAPFSLVLFLTSCSRSTLITLRPCRVLQPLLFLWVTVWRLTELPRCSSKSQSLITHSAPPGVIRSCRANTVSTAQCQPVPSHPPWLMETNLCRLKERQRNLFSTWYSCQQHNWCMLQFFPYVFKPVLLWHC